MASIMDQRYDAYNDHINEICSEYEQKIKQLEQENNKLKQDLSLAACYSDELKVENEKLKKSESLAICFVDELKDENAELKKRLEPIYDVYKKYNDRLKTEQKGITLTDGMMLDEWINIVHDYSTAIKKAVETKPKKTIENNLLEW